MERKLHLQVIAFDKDSGANYGENFIIGSKEDFDKEFNGFKVRVPFARWYYEIIPDEILTEEEETLVKEFEEL